MAYSRRQTIEEKNNRRKTTGFILLSIGFVLFMFFYGLPILVKLANLAYDFKKGSESIEINDKTPPPPPRLESLPEYTNKNLVEIIGGSEAGSVVIIDLNGQTEDVVSDNSGRFSLSLTITDGDNFIKAYAKDSSANKSVETQTYTVTFDNEPPKIEVSSPANNTEFYGSIQKSLTIKGTTEENSLVQINDRLAIVDSNGDFKYSVQLSAGLNTYIIKATDRAGNTAETSFQVTFTP